MNSTRLERLRQKMDREFLDAVIVLNLLNIRWLSGFSGSSGALVVTKEDIHLFTDSRYTIQAGQESPGTVVHISSDATYIQAAEYLASLEVANIAFESDVVTYDAYNEINSRLEGRRLAGYKGLVAELRYIKDQEEISRLRKAAEITDKAFEQIQQHIRPGRTEKDIARELVYILGGLGSECESFPSIVASGPRSALPHARPSDRQMQAGDVVLLDFGAQFEGYAGDITRTMSLGPADEQFKKVYSIVLEAQVAAIDAIKPGLTGKEIDDVARDIIASNGYGEYFGHGLGHMLGLDVHDGPGFSPRSQIMLEEGMVITVEPGIYLEEWGGVRIEDDVVVTETGAELLTRSPKHIIELPV